MKACRAHSPNGFGRVAMMSWMWLSLHGEARQITSSGD